MEAFRPYVAIYYTIERQALLAAVHLYNHGFFPMLCSALHPLPTLENSIMDALGNELRDAAIDIIFCDIHEAAAYRTEVAIIAGTEDQAKLRSHYHQLSYKPAQFVIAPLHDELPSSIARAYTQACEEVKKKLPDDMRAKLPPKRKQVGVGFLARLEESPGGATTDLGDSKPPGQPIHSGFSGHQGHPTD